jgi:hypothetical protein
VEVDVQGLLPPLITEFTQRYAVGDTGIRDRYVEPAMLADDPSDDVVDIPGVRNVEGLELCSAAGILDVLDQVRTLLRENIRHDDLGALTREGLGSCGTDPDRAARHEHYGYQFSSFPATGSGIAGKSNRISHL